ncbi:MAG TPA: NPCBM/NEW2 domain-containing protein [Magnetospirillum sp.]|nr:NPCBM/NEW2 domain-containing protein [Magnetospirillum sp.]
MLGKVVRLGVIAAVLGCVLLIDGPRPAAAADNRYVRVAYFVPTDRQVLPDHEARLLRIMEEIQRFYGDGMKANGYGRMAFDIERKPNGGLRIYQVQGREAAVNYGRNSSAKVREEVKQSLAAQGVDIDRETIVIFQVLLDWRGGKAIEVGPYVGGGGGGRGTAWVYDDAHLDPRLLSSSEPGGYYNGPVSWGEFNSHYLGGCAHELGHAFGLPHDAETASQRANGELSLMGGGNHTYGRQLRQEGRGAVLSPASAMALARHPLFRQADNVEGPANAELSNLRFVSQRGRLRVSGQVVGPTRAIGVIAYNDNAAIPDDYDAIGAVSAVSADGGFSLAFDGLADTSYELTLKIAGEDGRFRAQRMRYSVRDGLADVAGLDQAQIVADADAAFQARDRDRLEQLANGGGSTLAAAKITHFRRLLNDQAVVALADLPASQRDIQLSRVKLDVARTGYGPALRDQVRREGNLSVLLEVGGQFFPSGFYAHAPALHEVATDGAWRKLKTGYGLQDGHNGSATFVVLGDGRELFRSGVIKDHVVRQVEVDVSGVRTVQLVTDNAGDGASGDWAVWLAPQLMR